MNNVLRPLSLGEILDQTAQLYRRNFLLFAGTAVIPTAVIFGLYLVIAVAAGLPLFINTAAGRPPSPAFGVLFIVLMLAAMPFLLVPMVFSQAGVTRAAVNAFRGNKMRVREALAGVKPRFWRYLGLLLVQFVVVVGVPGVFAAAIIAAALIAARAAGPGFVILAGLGAFVLGAAAMVAIVLLGLSLCLGMATSVVEDMPAWEALKRARKLSKGARGRIFVMFLVVWCIMMALSMVGYIPTMLIVGIVAATGHGSPTASAALVVLQVVNLLVNFCMQTLVSPAYLVALVMFYFDQRVRLEGYDIEWMMQQAGLHVPLATTVPEVTVSAPQAGATSAEEQ